jgi:RTX calcium-binding nonapeptide repeat (4 copies)
VGAGRIPVTTDLPRQTLSYSNSGGADALLFKINTITGALTLVTPPDFQAPTDSGANNVYDVTVQARMAPASSTLKPLRSRSRIVTGATINGTNQAETLTGTGEADIINGLGGNDTLMAGPAPTRWWAAWETTPM